MSMQDSTKDAIGVRGGDIDPKTGREIDPVCGMTVHKHAFYRTTFENRVYKFCNEDCLKTFKANPMNYIGPRSNVPYKKNESKARKNVNENKQDVHNNKNESQGCCDCNKDEDKQCCSQKN